VVNRAEQHVTRNSPEKISMSFTLLLALAAIIVWALALVLTPVTTGLIHLLLALGTTLLVRWWALRG
jgi:hypothetical protein